MKTEIQTLIKAMRIVANDIQSADGIANAVVWEAAQRLDELTNENARLRTFIEANGLEYVG